MRQDADTITRAIVTRETRMRTGQASADTSSGERWAALNGEEQTLPGAGADAAHEGEGAARMGQIGRFVVLRRLGAGGMGVVYLAYDNALDRRVAIKVIRSLGAPDLVQTARMQREAQAMARLSHQNVLQIYEVGESEGSLFLAMEYVQGGSLGQWLYVHVSEDMSVTPVARDWRAIVAMFIQAGRGLAAAHQAGLIHRDFKPDNVLVGDDGVARVGDFGLVRVVAADPALSMRGEAPSHASIAELTLTRAAMGTPAYMSPEQHAGLATDARTDQFSFCVALWEALYGERPFNGDTLEALARAVRGGPTAPPPGSRVPSWLRDALQRGLAVEPAQRWPTMEALLAVLASDPVARRRRRVLAAGAGALVAAAIGLLAYATHEGQQRAEVLTQQADVATQQAAVASEERDQALEAAMRESIRARDTLRMASLRELERDPTSAALLLQEVEAPERAPEWTQTALATLATPLSAAVLRGHSNRLSAAVFLGDDDELVVTGAADRSARIWRRDGTGDPQVLPHADPVNDVVVSPERRRFVTLGEPTVRLWEVDASPGAPVRELHGLPGGAARSEVAAFTADGQRIATADRAGVVRLWEVDTGRVLATLSSHDARVTAIAFDLEGRGLTTGDDEGGLITWRSDGAGREPLARFADLVFAVHIAVNGQMMASSDARARVWSGDAKPRFDLRGHTAAITSATASPDGSEYATAAKDRTVRLWDAASGAERLRLEHRDEVEHVVYSPDARWLATIAGEHISLWRRDNPNIVYELHGGAPDKAVFSRDSAHLLSASGDHTARVWDLRRLAESMVFQTPAGGVGGALGGCDRGQMIALGADGTLRIWDCSGSIPVRERRLSTLKIYDFELDPAGTRVAYIDEGGVWIAALAEGQPRRVGVHPRMGWRVAFSPDGRHLISTGYDSTAHVWDLVGAAPPVVLRGHTSPLVWDAAWSPDGATIATIANDTSTRIWPIGPVLADIRRGPVELQASQAFKGHKRGAKTLAFSPDGKRVLTSSPDSTARIWDPLGVAAPVVLEGHRDMLYAAEWSPDGARVATASEDGTARIWRVDGAAPPLVLRGHRAGISTIAWHPGGLAVVTACADGTARVWDVERGVTSDIYVANREIQDARFTADGTNVMLVIGDDEARLWRPSLVVTPDTARLMQRLRAATTACLTAQQREHVLLEDSEQAWAAHAACEARHGRTPDPHEGIYQGHPLVAPLKSTDSQSSSPSVSPAGVSQSKGG